MSPYIPLYLAHGGDAARLRAADDAVHRVAVLHQVLRDH